MVKPLCKTCNKREAAHNGLCHRCWSRAWDKFHGCCSTVPIPPEDEEDDELEIPEPDEDDNGIELPEPAASR